MQMTPNRNKVRNEVSKLSVTKGIIYIKYTRG